MKKSQLKISNYALTELVRRLRTRLRDTEHQRKLYQSRARTQQKDIVTLMAAAVDDKATLNQLNSRILHLENRVVAPPGGLLDD